jgi:hypothetical protein
MFMLGLGTAGGSNHKLFRDKHSPASPISNQNPFICAALLLPKKKGVLVRWREIDVRKWFD